MFKNNQQQATVTLIKKVDRTVDIIQRAQKLHLFLSTFFINIR